MSRASPLTSPSPLSLDHASAKVAVLLCTMNGGRYLKEQLDSIINQTHKNVEIWVSDDASSDDTLEILSQYQKQFGNSRFFIQSGPSSGFATNFLTLVSSITSSASYFAFSDQDDIWNPDKISRALASLERMSKTLPALYFSRTLLVDENNAEIGESPLFVKPPCFANALVQNIGGGNTIMFNQPAMKLLRLAGANPGVYLHDWWTYIVVSACGGRIFYDPVPSLRYRQHTKNLVGCNDGWPARLIRLRRLFRGHFRTWNDQHIQALQKIFPYITPENQKIMNNFVLARQSIFPLRMWKMLQSGVYRQTLFGNLSLMLATVCNKI